MNDTEVLLQRKKKIGEAKEQKAQAQGKLDMLMDHLKTTNNCTSIAQAEKALKKMDVAIDKNEKAFDAGLIELDRGWPCDD